MSEHHILGDWGSSRLRLWLVCDGTIVDRREGPGIIGLVGSPLDALQAAIEPRGVDRLGQIAFLKQERDQVVEHRRDLQRHAQKHNLVVALSGRGAALIFSLAALSVAAFALYLGYPWAAGVIGGTTIALVVAAFTGVPNLFKQRSQAKIQEQQPPQGH